MQLDVILAEHLAEKFNVEHGDGGDDVRKNPKAMAKLIRQARLCSDAALAGLLWALGTGSKCSGSVPRSTCHGCSHPWCDQ